MFQLIHKTETEFAMLKDALSRAIFGDVIRLHRGDTISSWEPHENGILNHRDSEELFLNDSHHPLTTTPWNDYKGYDNGVMLQTNEGLIYNGKKLYTGEHIRWDTNLQKSFFVENKHRVLIDGKDEICKLAPGQIWQPWPGTRDIVVRVGNMLLRNGKTDDVIYQGTPDMKGYTMCKQGPIVKEGDSFYFNREVVYDALYENYDSNTHGLLVENNHEITLIVIK